MENNIHRTALVDKEAKIGSNVAIGPYSVIEAGTEIGDNCVIGPHVTIFGCVRLGSESKVHAGAVLGDLPQDMAHDGSASFVEIGSNCVIREGVTIHRGTREGSVTRVGANCFLMALSHLAHDVQLDEGVILGNAVLLAGYAKIGKKVFASGNSMVHQFVSIGRNAMLGGGCAVSKDVPPFVTMRPAAFNAVAGLNVIGMRRAGMDAAARLEVKRAMKLLYHSGLNRDDAVAAIRAELSTDEALAVADFAENSSRGLCGWHLGGKAAGEHEESD